MDTNTINLGLDPDAPALTDTETATLLGRLSELRYQRDAIDKRIAEILAILDAES